MSFTYRGLKATLERHIVTDAEIDRQIAENAGVDGSVVYATIRASQKVGYGYNAYSEEYVDMIPAGIVDPTKVTRSSLENAASIAACVLTTESLVVDKPDPAAEAAAAAAAAQGGMYSGASLKTLLSGCGRIFASNYALRKHRNTQSIPVFPNLYLEANPSPTAPKNSFQRLPGQTTPDAPPEKSGGAFYKMSCTLQTFPWGKVARRAG